MREVRLMQAVVRALVVASLAGCGGVAGESTSSDATLSSLTIAEGVLVPAFSPSTLTYVVGPAVLSPSVTVTATAADAHAEIRVNMLVTPSGQPSAPVSLGVGVTLATVLVTAEDGVTQQSYEIAFDRTSAELSGLTASAGTLAPAFDAGTLAYGVGPALLPGSSTLTATAVDPGATIRVNGLPVPSGLASGPIDLSGGGTAAAVDVTARDGTTMQTYAVAFDRSLRGQEAYVKASVRSGFFGYSVALSGDTMVVGADGESGGGAAYVFVRTGTTWTQQARLIPSNLDVGDRFGASVAIDGDTLVVGAWGEASAAVGVDQDEADDSASNAGAAYVFVRTGTTWAQQAYLKASNTSAGDWFGSQVAISGDTVAVGVQREDSGATGIGGNQADESATDSGAAYVFTRSGGTWAQQAYLKASNASAGDYFGTGVAVSGETLVVGASLQTAGARWGATYVFVRSGTTWSEQAILRASNAGTGDQFGGAVGASGDTIVVGAPREGSNATGVNGNQADNSAVQSGAAYVFVRAGTTWSQQAYLKPSNTDARDNFGQHVAISGDTIVVGAPFESSVATGVNGDSSDNTAQSSGAAYVFVRTGVVWSQAAYVKASNPTPNDLFGESVAASADTVAVGAWQEDSAASGVDGNQADNTATDSGAAYVFR